MSCVSGLHLRPGRHAGQGKEACSSRWPTGRQVLLERGYVGRQRESSARRWNQDANLARLVLGRQAVKRIESHGHLAADKSVVSRAEPR